MPRKGNFYPPRFRFLKSVKNFCRRSLVLFTAFLFTGTTLIGNAPLGAQGAPELSFQIPSSLGDVVDYHPGQKKGPFIIHIQDAHSHPEAQARIRDILNHWNTPSSNPLLIVVEGSHGRLHPEYLDLFPRYPEINQAIVEALAAKGELSGAEQFAWEEYQASVIARRPIGRRSNLRSQIASATLGTLPRNDYRHGQTQFMGVEDPELYRQNLRLYRSLVFKRDEIERLLGPLRKELESEKAKVFSHPLRRFVREKERRKEAYGAYFSFLARAAKDKLKIDLEDAAEAVRFPELSAISELSARFKPGTQQLDMEALWKELIRLEAWILEKLITRKEERRLLYRLKEFNLLEKLLKLELTRGEYTRINRQSLRGSAKNMAEAIYDRKTQIALPAGRQAPSAWRPPRNDWAIQILISHSLRFYRGAARRDRVLLENALKAQREFPNHQLVLITGGFHTAALQRLLENKNRGYAVVRPRIVKSDGRNHYLESLRDTHVSLAVTGAERLSKQQALLLKQLLEIAAPHLKRQGHSNQQITLEISRLINRHPIFSGISSQAGFSLPLSYPPLSGERGKEGLSSIVMAASVGDTAFLTHHRLYLKMRAPVRPGARGAKLSARGGSAFGGKPGTQTQASVQIQLIPNVETDSSPLRAEIRSVDPGAGLKPGTEESGRIAVVGLSDAGLVTAALFAQEGYQVTAIDTVAVLDRVLESTSEPGLQALIDEALEKKYLHLVSRSDEAIEDAIRDNSIIYLDSGNPEGLSPSEYISRLDELATMVGAKLKRVRSGGKQDHRVFILRGVVSPGTSERIYRIISRESGKDKNFGIAYQPHFIRSGRMVKDMRENQIVFGLREIHSPWEGEAFLEQAGNPTWKIIKRIIEPFRARGVKITLMSLEAAELGKKFNLTFLSAKVVFEAALAAVVGHYGGDLSQVGLGMGLDKRITLSLTNPWVASGGRAALFLDFGRTDESRPRRSAEEVKMELDLLEDTLATPGVALDAESLNLDFLYSLWIDAILATNEENLKFFQSEIAKAFEMASTQALKGSRVAVLGVAYKPGTDLITESPALPLIEWLVERGVAEIHIYDPLALDSLKAWLEEKKSVPASDFLGVEFVFHHEPLAAMRGKDAAIYTIPLDELRVLPLEAIKEALGDGLLFDGPNLYSGRTDVRPGRPAPTIDDLRKAGINRIGFGIPPVGPLFDSMVPFPAQTSDFYPADKPLPVENPGPQEVTVMGAGYVGLNTGGLLVDLGHRVRVVDILESRIAGLAATPTRIPIYEPGLPELIERGKASGRLSFTTDGDQAIRESQIVYLAVGTPQKDNGEVNLDYILEASLQFGRVIQEMNIEERQKRPKLLVIKSTVPPNAFPAIEERLNELGLTVGEDYLLASNPEFLKEGSAVLDSTQPDRTVFGIYSRMWPEAIQQARQLLFALWQPLREKERHPHPVLATDTATSAAIKLGTNSLLATQISAANLFAHEAQSLGTFYEWVRTVSQNDPRIGDCAFLAPGMGYGGSCFPKDVRALNYLAGQKLGHAILLIRLADLVNEVVKRRGTHELAKAMLGEDLARGVKPLEGKRVAVAGLTFKADTDDLREASSVSLVLELTLLGANVVLYDPLFNIEPGKRKEIEENFKKELAKRMKDPERAERLFQAKDENSRPQISFADDLPGLFQGADALVIVNEWQELKDLLKRPDFSQLVSSMRQEGPRNLVIMDGRGVWKAEEIQAKAEEEGFFSPGVGRPPFGEPWRRSEMRRIFTAISTAEVKALLRARNPSSLDSEGERKILGPFAAMMESGILPVRLIIRFNQRPKITAAWLPLLKRMSKDHDLRLFLEVRGVLPNEADSFENELKSYGESFGIVVPDENLQIYPTAADTLGRETRRIWSDSRHPVGLVSLSESLAELGQYAPWVLRVNSSKLTEIEAVVTTALEAASLLERPPDDLTPVFTPEDLARYNGHDFTDFLVRTAKLAEYIATQA